MPRRDAFYVVGSQAVRNVDIWSISKVQCTVLD